LLQHHAVCSFEELQSHNGLTYLSFQEAAIRSGLLAGDQEGKYALTEAVASLYTPFQLQLLFVDILISEGTNTPSALWESFKDSLSKDYYIQCGSNAMALNLSLIEIGQHLTEHGKSLTNYGFEIPEEASTEVQHELEHWAPYIDNLMTSADQALTRFNHEQREIYELIMNAVQYELPLQLFIDGKAGRGKTFLLKAICDKLQALGKIILPTATSAFAAQMYAGGRTTHSAFKVFFFLQSISTINFT
jgi:hypothetical protein